jgi:integrase
MARLSVLSDCFCYSRLLQSYSSVGTAAKNMSRRKSQGGKIRGIYLRGNTFWYGRMVAGKRLQVSLGTSDQGEAVVKALEVRADPFLMSADPLSSEVEAFLDHKRRQNEYSAASVDAKKYALQEFASFAGKADPAQITTADVERFYQQLRARVAESTAQGYITTLRSFFNRLFELRKVRANVVKGVRLGRLDTKGRTTVCTKAVVNRLIAGCKRNDLKFVLFCGFHAGLRKAEIIEARPDWFDLKAGLVHVRKTDSFRPKDRDERTIPMTKAFKRFLKEYGLQSPFMLHPEVPHGNSRYRWDFRRPWADYVGKQKHPEITPHVARHTFASLLASAGVSIYKIAQWLGDDVRVVQKHYAKLLPKDADIELAF